MTDQKILAELVIFKFPMLNLSVPTDRPCARFTWAKYRCILETQHLDLPLL